MSCAYDKERLTGYYDGELAPADKAEVEKHISTCSECLRDLGEIKSSALLVKELPRLRAPASIAQAVARETRPAGRLHSLEKWRKGMLWAVSAAAALLVVVNVIYFTGGSRESAPVASSADPGLAWTGLPQKPPSDDVKANLPRDSRDHAEGKEATFGDAQRRTLDEAARKIGRNEATDNELKNREKNASSAPKRGAEDGKPREEAAKAAPATAAPPPAAAPAPKPQAANELLAREAGKPKQEAAPEAKKPAAPAGPAPAPAPGEFRKDARDRALADTEEQKARLRQGAPEPAKGKDAGPGAAAPTCLLVTASDSAASRRKAQEFGKSKAETGGLSYSLHEGRRGVAGAPEPVELFLTDRQIEELKQTLASEQAAVQAVATPEEAGAMCVARVQQQAGDKALAGAGGRAPAAPADPGLAAKKASEPAKPAARKEADALLELEKAEAERPKADAPVAGAKAEPRRRVLLYFRAALPGEVAPPAAEKKK